MSFYVGEIVSVFTAHAETPEPIYTGIVMAIDDEAGKVTIYNEEIGEETHAPYRAVRTHGEPF